MPVHQHLTEAGGVAANPGYAHAAVASGRVAYISGQVALDAGGQVVGAGDLAAQTAQALRNLRAILGELGAGWPEVLRLSWYMLDVREVQVVRDVRDAVLRPELGELPNPASTLVQVAALVRPEFLVEVEAVAALPG